MYEIVPTHGGQDPLDLLIEQEALAAYQWDCELEADSPNQTVLIPLTVGEVIQRKQEVHVVRNCSS